VSRAVVPVSSGARRRARVLALGGIVGPLLFAAVAVVCGALRPGYSHVTQFVSELGETGGSHSALMNLLGFVPAGLLFVAFGVALGHVAPRTASSVVAALLIVVYGLGVTGAGVYSCDPGCPTDNLSRAAALHLALSMTAFVAGIAGMALWAYCFRARRGWRPLWRFSAVSSALALALLVVFLASQPTRSLTGVWQRLFVATLDLWCAIVGWRALRVLGDPDLV